MGPFVDIFFWCVHSKAVEVQFAWSALEKDGILAEDLKERLVPVNTTRDLMARYSLSMEHTPICYNSSAYIHTAVPTHPDVRMQVRMQAGITAVSGEEYQGQVCGKGGPGVAWRGGAHQSLLNACYGFR